jgi:hypothetical protein
MNRLARQIAVLIGIGVFRWQGRLTGFRAAGKIIRIRTNTGGGERHGYRRRPPKLRHEALLPVSRPTV